MNSYKQKKIEEIIKKILKPFIYKKYGKTYIGYYETEGALRVEGMVLELGNVLSKIIDETEKEAYEKGFLEGCKKTGTYEQGFIDGQLKQIEEKIGLEMEKASKPCKHKWKLINQISHRMHTNENHYKCEKCGKTKQTYSNPWGEHKKDNN